VSFAANVLVIRTGPLTYILTFAAFPVSVGMAFGNYGIVSD